LTAGQVMTPVDGLFQADSDEDVLTLLQKMGEAKVNQVPVMDNGHLLGVFSREGLLRHIRLRNELGVWRFQRAKVQEMEAIA
jgi:predicted transcriptional regulator